MTTTRTPFFATYATLLKLFGLAMRSMMNRSPHYPKTRTGVSAKGPWGRHRGSEFRGYRRAAARGPNSYAEHDMLVRNFGAVDTRNFERGGRGPVSTAMRGFLDKVRAGLNERIALVDVERELSPR